MDFNADTCCLGKKFIVVSMTDSTANVYTYDNTYETMYTVPIVTGALTYTDRNTGRLFIIFMNESLYYNKKLVRSLINPNQLCSYRTMVWDKPFYYNIEIYVETEYGNKIYLIANGIDIEFDSIAPTDN